MTDRATALFGLFDGMTSTIGMVIALALFGTLHALVLATVAGAVGAGSSMAAGQWLADAASSVHRAAIMGAATLFGCLAPAVPFYISRSAASFAACGVIVTALGMVIAKLRPGAWWPSIGRTFGVLIVAGGLSIGAGAAGS